MSVAPHEHLRDPAESQRSFAVRFRFHEIFAPNNYDIPEALNLAAWELKSNQLSTFLLEVSGRLKHFGLGLPLILPRADDDSVWWHQFLEVFVSLANQARQTASRALRISLRPSALDAAKFDPIDTTIPTSATDTIRTALCMLPPLIKVADHLTIALREICAAQTANGFPARAYAPFSSG
ncbi:MAG: hypothetical protein WB951_15705 [Candidatus Sulfotelmatobacter sp.]